MTEQLQPLMALVREIDSDFYEPSVHGQGVVVAWHKRKQEWVSGQGTFDKLFGQKHLRHFFVQTSTKPIQFKKIAFEWSDGTSDITLDLDANFNITLVDKSDAQKFVSELLRLNAVALHEGLFQLLDQQLHSCMDSVYDACMSAVPRQNLLDEFYKSESHKGESDKLNDDVSKGVRSKLADLPFGIGFTLKNAPDRIADFSHCTVLKRSPSLKAFNVQSECTLKLTNYQSYKKSGFSDLDDVKAHMMQVIDQAIQEHVSGKTLFDLFSRFESDLGKEKAIATLVRERVESEATSIGYSVKTFYSLPDVAPLKLLNGIRVDIDESDGAFSTGYGGGSIKINASLDVKAIHGDFNKLLHLLSPSGDYENLDVLDFTYVDLVARIKKPLLAICARVVKQQDSRLASTDFENQVKPPLENELASEMSNLYGLQVSLKSVFPVETEDSTRLRELSGSAKTLTFAVLAQEANQNDVMVEFQTAFRVHGIDLENGWEAFEQADFGYRSNSAKRAKFEGLNLDDPDYDRQCKTLAIKDELEDIAAEITRLIKADLQLLPGLSSWCRDAKSNRELQYHMLEKVEDTIKVTRGLSIRMELLTIDDGFMVEEVKSERKTRMEHIATANELRGKEKIEQIKHDVERKRTFDKQVDDKRHELIKESDDISTLQEIEDNQVDPLSDVTDIPDSVSQTLTSSDSGQKKDKMDGTIAFLTNTKRPYKPDDKEDL